MISKLLIQQLLDGSKSGEISGTNNSLTQNQSNQIDQPSLWSYDNNSQQQQRASQDNRPFKH